MRYPGAEWIPSPNFNTGRDGQGPSKIVIHQTDGGPRFSPAVEHLCKTDTDHRVSAHFLIGQAGEVVQLVDTDDTAWHCSGWNHESIGIEHNARTPGELNHKWAGLSVEHRTALVLPGTTTDSDTDPGLPLTAPQLTSSAALVRWLQQKYPGAEVVPHCACPTTTHKDCGRDVAEGGIWPWSEYRKLLSDANLHTQTAESV